MKAFISYSSRDEQRIVGLIDDLASLGHQVWRDDRLTGGQAWWDEILRQIRDTDLFVFAISPASLKSEACMSELTYAQALAKYILPLRIAHVDSSALPSHLNRLQFLDYIDQSKPEVIGLATALSRVQRRDALPRSLPVPPPVPESYTISLRARLAAKSMDGDAQVLMLQKLKEHLQTDEDPKDVRDLLQLFRQRADLLASVAHEIDDLLVPAKGQNSSTIVRKDNERTYRVPYFNMEQLAEAVRRRLIDEGCETQIVRHQGSLTIQGRKGGRRAWVGMALAATVVLAPAPNGFSAHVGGGKWISQGTAMTVGMITLASGLGIPLLVTGGVGAWQQRALIGRLWIAIEEHVSGQRGERV